MKPEEWRKVRAILEQALELLPEQRRAFLESQCSGDLELRREVESLLRSDEQASTDFLEMAPLGAAPEDISSESGTPAGKRIGPYQIVQEIGKGGMGSVFLAARADDQYHKQVAIKLVRGGLGGGFRTHRFKAERQILADLDHPNIARLLDGGALDDGQPYVVMEYIQGQPIDKFCDARKLTVSARLRLFRTVCSAVAYAHQRLVIHRDIKPDNILVTGAGEPKLLDFGIAKILDADASGDATVTAMRAMTPEYASPEQVRGEAMTTASDVYSLGVVLYGLLTGRRPYPAESRLPHEIAQAVCDVEPEKPSTAIDRSQTVPDLSNPEMSVRAADGSREKLRRRLHGDLDNIVLKALRKEPERRYASVEQFSEDIRRHLEGLPVIARADTFGYRAGKFARRHKAGVIAAASVAAALVAGLAITMRETYVARAERARAEQRFNDVRELANSLLFEVHDAIQNLPGSTTARKLIVDRALRYLDALAKEAKGNLSLQRELASAYQKVGDVQGGFRAANLGDTAGALASYKKSLVIFEAVAAADPGNIETLRELIRAHGKLSDVLVMSGDRTGAIEQSKQVLAIAQRLAATDPGNVEEKRNLSLAYLDYGSKRAGKDDWPGALEDCRKAVPLLESVAAANPSDQRTRRVLGLAYGRTGELLSQYAHNHVESQAMHEKAIGVFRVLLAQDPQNVDLRRLAAWDTSRTGDETAEQGNPTEALEKYHAALNELQAVSAADVNDVQIRIQVAIVRGRLGAALLQLGNAKAAIAELQGSLNDFQRFAKPGASNTDMEWAMTYDQFNLGRAYSRLASDARSPAVTRHQDLQQALQWYQRSLPGLAASKNNENNQMAEDMLKDAGDNIARCQQELKRFDVSRR